MTGEEDLVIIEPYLKFRVVNSGIHRDTEKSSIVPLEMVIGEKLIYGAEIEPNVSMYALKAMKEEIGDIEITRRILRIISKHKFDNGSNENPKYRFLSSKFVFPLDYRGHKRELLDWGRG